MNEILKYMGLSMAVAAAVFSCGGEAPPSGAELSPESAPASGGDAAGLGGTGAAASSGGASGIGDASTGGGLSAGGGSSTGGSPATGGADGSSGGSDGDTGEEPGSTFTPRPAKGLDETGTFTHPGVYSSMGQLEFIKQKVLAGEQPWKEAYDELLATNPTARAITAQAVVPGSADPKERREMDEMTKDGEYANAAALLWYFTGEKKYADFAIETLNAWSRVRAHRHATLPHLGRAPFSQRRRTDGAPAWFGMETNRYRNVPHDGG